MSDFRYYKPSPFPPVVKNLIIINVLVYIAQLTLGRQFGLTEKIMLYPVEDPNFHPYQLVTHMFAHAPNLIAHIVFNMFALWMFGRILENHWGGKRFLIFYLICGLGAACFHLGVEAITWQRMVEAFNNGNMARFQELQQSVGPALGASGAVMGVLAAFGYLFPNTELYIMFIPVPIKAKWAVLGMAAFDLFGGLTNFSGDNVAHFAHLGGAITGFILVFIWNRTNRKRFY